MNVPQLGMVKNLDPRSIWPHEAGQFTPWLADNISRLNEALGIEIEVIGREVPVGGFAVDLLGRESGSGQNVIIENQLEATDHGHLGQLLTYAAGLDAAIIVWVSPTFRDEHKKAIDWLNVHTTDSVSLFGVQLDLIQIGDSLPAPLFKVLAQPGEWKPAALTGSPATSERRQAYHDFFGTLLDALKTTSPGFTNTSRAGYENWLGFSAGRSGFGYTVSFVSGGRFRVELYIDLGDQTVNKAVFDKFLSVGDELNRELGYELTWHRLEHRRASRICIERDGNIMSSDEELANLRTWGVKNLIRFREVFTPRIREMEVPVPSEAEPEIETRSLE